MRHVVFNSLGGYHSHGCATPNTPKINFSIFIENPYKIAGLTYEPEFVDTKNSTYHCEIGHYIKTLISADGGRTLLTTIVPDEFIDTREAEYEDMREKIFPLIASKFVARNLVEYAYEELEDNICSACYALKFVLKMLDRENLFPARHLQGKVTTTIFDNLMEKVRDAIEKSNIRLKPDKVLINDELMKIRQSSVVSLPSGTA